MKKIAISLSLVCIVSAIVLDTHFPFIQTRGEERLLAMTIEEVLKEQTKEWMLIPGVVGTGLGLCDKKPCIKVFVIERTPELNQKIPRTIEGYPVVMEETGVIRALPKD